MIRAKKPWAVAGVSALMLGLALSYVFYYSVWNQVHPEMEVQGVSWNTANGEAKNVAAHSQQLRNEDDAKQKELKLLQRIGQEVAGGTDRRVLWLEVMKAINNSLPPMDPTGTVHKPGDPPPDPQKLPFIKRQDLKIEYIESQFYQDLGVWFTDQVKTRYLDQNPELAAATGQPATGGPAPATSTNSAQPAGAQPAAGAPAPATPMGSTGPAMTPGGGMGYGGAGATMATGPKVDVSSVNIEGPKGPGWVIEIKGHHFFNDPKGDRRLTGPALVRSTLLKNLEHGLIDVPLGPGQPMHRFTHKDLGIGYAILVLNPRPRDFRIPNPNFVSADGQGQGDGAAAAAFGAPAAGARGAGKAAAKDDPNNPEFYIVPRYDFIIQFCWQEKAMSDRLAEQQKRLAAEEEARKAAEAAAAAAAQNGQTAAPATNVPATTPPQTPVQANPVTPAPVPAAPVPAAPVPAPATPTPASPAPGVPTAPAEAAPAAPAAVDPTAPMPAPMPAAPAAPVVPE
jgi:type IV pilus assembly protein PilM